MYKMDSNKKKVRCFFLASSQKKLRGYSKF